MRGQLRSLASLIVLGLVFIASPATAQTTYATITGTVTDSSGGVIAGAEVAATNVETSITTKTTTNADGVYNVTQLREGPYILSITAPGLREFIETNILLVARDIRRIDAKLEVGVLTEAIQVVGGATPIELETPRVSDVRTAEQLRTLPLNDPGVWSFLAVTPTVSLRAGTYSFAGSKLNQSQFTIDGTTMSDGVGETPVGPLANYIESFKEVKIDIANNSAEFPSLGQVTIISKSGANRFSGSLFDYYQGPSFRAKNPFSGQRQAGWVHFPGAGGGGPVVIPGVYNGRSRTFWYASGETVDGSDTSVDLNPTVPLDAWRRGDFSALGRPIRNPFTGEVYADGRIPASALSPVALKLQDRFYPLPNTGNTAVLQSNNYRETVTVPRSKPYYWTARLDHDVNATNRMYGRFTLSQNDNPVWEGNLPAFGIRDQLRKTRALTMSYTRIMGGSLVSEFRGGYTYNNNPISGPVKGLDLVNSLGVQGLAPGLPDISGVLKVSFPGSGLSPLTQVDWTNPGFLNRIYSLQNQTTWQRGTHTMKAGAEIRRIDNDETLANANLFGAVDFTGRFTAVPGIAASGHPYADFLFGVPNTASRAFPPIATQRRRWTYDFFAQDDWKVTRDLTLNLGVRYDLHPGWFERSGREAFFDITSGKIVVPDDGLDKVSPLMPAGYVGVVTASSLGLPSSSLIRTDRNNFAPRIGFAYRPVGGASTVVRGGYGLYYDMTPIDLQAARAPFVLSESPFTNPATPTVVFPTVFPAAGTSGPAAIGLPLAVNPDIGLPYTHQFNVTVEHERWNTGFRVSYVATLGRDMWYERDANAPQPDNRLYTEKPRPFPQFPNINYADKGGSHDYQALMFEAERRFSKGLFFQIAYTAARDLGDTGGNAANGGNYTTVIENPFDLARERGRDVATPTHRVTSAVMWELPFGRERRWLANAPGAVDAALGGWELSLVGYLQTGGYLTPTITVPDPTGTVFTNAATRPNVSIRPDLIRDPNIDPNAPGGDVITAFPWYDITAFGAPAIGRFGTSGRGVIEGPGLNLWHFGVHKRFRLTDRAAGPTLRVELTTTNVFNTPQWSNPNLNVTPTNVSAGRITGVGGPAGFIQQAGVRAMRLGARLEW